MAGTSKDQRVMAMLARSLVKLQLKDSRNGYIFFLERTATQNQIERYAMWHSPKKRTWPVIGRCQEVVER